MKLIQDEKNETTSDSAVLSGSGTTQDMLSTSALRNDSNFYVNFLFRLRVSQHSTAVLSFYTS